MTIEQVIVIVFTAFISFLSGRAQNIVNRRNEESEKKEARYRQEDNRTGQEADSYFGLYGQTEKRQSHYTERQDNSVMQDFLGAWLYSYYCP